MISGMNTKKVAVDKTFGMKNKKVRRRRHPGLATCLCVSVCLSVRVLRFKCNRSCFHFECRRRQPASIGTNSTVQPSLPHVFSLLPFQHNDENNLCPKCCLSGHHCAGTYVFNSLNVAYSSRNPRSAIILYALPFQHNDENNLCPKCCLSGHHYAGTYVFNSLNVANSSRNPRSALIFYALLRICLDTYLSSTSTQCVLTPPPWIRTHCTVLCIVLHCAVYDAIREEKRKKKLRLCKWGQMQHQNKKPG